MLKAFQNAISTFEIDFKLMFVNLYWKKPQEFGDFLCVFKFFL